jgi:hypothetical protein
MSRLLHKKITLVNKAPDIVTVEEVKCYCRIDFDDDDVLLQRLIRSSRERLQEYTGRVFLLSNCEATYVQEGCGDRVALKFSDNIELSESSPYKDSLIGDSYINTTDKEVKLNYRAGYDVEEVPEWMKQAVIMDVAYRYENRGDVATIAGQINTELKDFLRPYLNWGYL